jgi:hypothetical protein
MPRGLRASRVTSSAVTLSWPAASDDRGVASYEVQWNDGAAWRFFSRETTTSVTLRAMTPNATYSFRVRAADAAGNVSGWATTSVRTLRDRRSPSRPGTPKLLRRTSSSVSLSWAAARDDVRVRSYLLWEQVGRRWKVVARPARPRVTVSGLRPGTAHRYRVQAVDWGGNRSPNSGVSTLRTRGAAGLGGTALRH